MATYIEMPKLSDTMTEGTLLKWRKKDGDKVEVGDILAEIETDKATMEMEAFDDGILHKTFIAEGEKVPIGSRIALLLAKGEEPPAKEEAAAPKAKPAAASQPDKAERSSGERTPATHRTLRVGSNRRPGEKLSTCAKNRGRAGDRSCCDQWERAGWKDHCPRCDAGKADGAKSCPFETHRCFDCPAAASRPERQTPAAFRACGGSLPNAWSRAKHRSRTFICISKWTPPRSSRCARK